MASSPIQVGSHQDITEESFSLFWMLEPRIGMGAWVGLCPKWPTSDPQHMVISPFLEIVVVGTGNKTERLHPQVLQAMRQRGIAVEVQDTVGLQTWKCSPAQAYLSHPC